MRVLSLILAFWLCGSRVILGIDPVAFATLDGSQQVQVIRSSILERDNSAKLLRFDFQTIAQSARFKDGKLTGTNVAGGWFAYYDGWVQTDSYGYLINLSESEKNGAKHYDSLSHRDFKTGVVRSLNSSFDSQNKKDAFGFIKTVSETFLMNVRIGSWIGIQEDSQSEGSTKSANWFKSLQKNLDSATIESPEGASTIRITVSGLSYAHFDVDRSYELDVSNGFRPNRIVTCLRSEGRIRSMSTMDVDDWTILDGVSWPTKFREYGFGWDDQTDGTHWETTCTVTKAASDTKISVAFPEGTPVFDKIRGIRYKEGESAELPIFERGRALQTEPLAVAPNVSVGYEESNRVRTALLAIGGLLLTISIIRFGWIRYRNR